MTASYNLELLYLHLQPNYNQFNYSTMAKITKEAALLYHSQGKPGKIEVVPTKPYSTQTDLSLAYSPGVAEPCLEIEKNPQDAYKYTAKGNLVAVISNGTAVLGLGDIGALSGKPVMEGKGLLFKIYAGIGSRPAAYTKTNCTKRGDGNGQTFQKQTGSGPLCAAG